MNALLDFSNPYAIVGALFLLVVIVIAVWGALHPKPPVKQPKAPEEMSASEAEMEYLDSSHIISGPLVGRDGARVIREPPVPGKPGERPKAKS